MNRREVVAGVGSLAVFSVGAGFAARGVPFLGGDDEVGTDPAGDDDGPIEVETIDARGSEAGTVVVPDGDRPTLLAFFVTGCGNCQAQMPRLAATRAALEETDVRFLSTTYQPRRMISEEALADWWDRLDGDWSVGYEEGTGLSRRYGIVGYPTAAIVDADGELAWKTDRPTVLSTDELVAAVESATGPDTGDDDGSGSV